MFDVILYMFFMLFVFNKIFLNCGFWCLVGTSSRADDTKNACFVSFSVFGVDSRINLIKQTAKLKF